MSFCTTLTFLRAISDLIWTIGISSANEVMLPEFINLHHWIQVSFFFKSSLAHIIPRIWMLRHSHYPPIDLKFSFVKKGRRSSSTRGSGNLESVFPCNKPFCVNLTLNLMSQVSWSWISTPPSKELLRILWKKMIYWLKKIEVIAAKSDKRHIWFFQRFCVSLITMDTGELFYGEFLFTKHE